MKKINPAARYFETNEWAVLKEDHFVIGITDFAQTVFGQMTFVELPAIGAIFQQRQPFALTESNKAANEIFMPLSGKIIAVNSALKETIELLNEDPYGAGWLVKINVTNPSEWEALMDAEAYKEFIGVFFKKT